MIENESVSLLCILTGQLERIDIQWNVGNGSDCSVASEILGVSCHKEGACSMRNSMDCLLHSLLDVDSLSS